MSDDSPGIVAMREAIRQLRTMHSSMLVNEAQPQWVCRECDQAWPCNTIRFITADGVDYEDRFVDDIAHQLKEIAGTEPPTVTWRYVAEVLVGRYPGMMTDVD